MTTKIIPTDKFGNVYYGAKTYREVEQMIDDGASPGVVANHLEEAGYVGLAQRIRKDYGFFFVSGKQIQIDRSGVGHCWKDISKEDIPASVVEEIEGEIEDGKKKCSDFVASNGQHYRW